MAGSAADGERDKLAIEHDLYRRLLSLGREQELSPLLHDALALIVEITGVSQGYLELYDDDDDPCRRPRWCIAHGFSDTEIEAVRSAVSRGIIAEAVASGTTIVTPSALLDARFKARESVRLSQIGAVLCTPVGQDPPRGVLYLQGGAKEGLFGDEDRERAEIFAHHLARLVDPLLAEQRREQPDDPTLALRSVIRVPGVIGRSPAFAAVLKEVSIFAPLDATVLLTGQSGTGKSVLARAMHDNGPRAGKPFIEVNCGALPEALLENELFGALAGGHSTATQPIKGKVAAADGGTLFLDEIGVLPLAAQSKLLHLLQSKQYSPLGSSKSIVADVRIIAATNADLKQAVAEKTFREDLFYRLHVLTIRAPTLAERREDIPDLMRFFCSRACSRDSFAAMEVSRDAIRLAQAADWPGNVRQLENAIERAVVRCAGEQRAVIERTDVFPDADAATNSGPADLTFQAATRRFQEDLIRRVLEDTNWNVAETADRLDLTRSHVYNLIRVFGLARSDNRM
jgi:Nif-specific regulatory protein